MQLLRHIGEKGVAAYGVICYAGFIFCAIFFGYNIGIAPVIGYHNGAQNHAELKSLLKKSTIIVGVFSLLMFATSEVLRGPISSIFVGYDQTLYEMTKYAFFIYGFSFLFSGFGIFGSSFFTALNDGLTSGAISFMRTLVFQTIAVFTLPLVMGLDGIWLSLVIAEALSCILTVFCVIGKRKKYKYL